MQAEVLVLDQSGFPMRWASLEDVAVEYAAGRVVWDLGQEDWRLRGGINARTGEQSVLHVRPLVAIRGALRNAHAPVSPVLAERSNALLFRRDRHICAYCGEPFDERHLTRDHIIPRCRGGLDTWTNCVTACVRCNQAKGARRVEDFRPLLYVPYAPCRNEQLLLARRHILADQMEYLAARLPKHSRALA